jgi:hypothetical protein
LRCGRAEHRLLKKKDTPVARASRQKLLRPLKDELPAEM